MLFFRKLITHFFLLVYNREVLKLFYSRNFEKDQRSIQFESLKKQLIYSYERFEFYKKSFDACRFNPYEFSDFLQLQCLPIINKEILKQNFECFNSKSKPGDCKQVSTGGSTGVPFKYLMGSKNRKSSLAVLFKGWSLGGYKLGEPVAVLAGGSLVGNNDPLVGRIRDSLLNIHKFSTYGMDEDQLRSYFKKINKIKPKYIRGYASAVYLFAIFLEKNNLTLSFKTCAVFTTAEMLTTKYRNVIERVFNCSVYDGYGLNDGAVTAFECSEHNGYHIDVERSYLEVTDESGNVMTDIQGKIIATTINETCMPLIRYDTGDLGILSSSHCKCGSAKRMLKEISGRVTDFIKINKKIISSPVLTVLMGKVRADQYQIEQLSKSSLRVKLFYSQDSYFENDKRLISKSLKNKLGNFNLEIITVNSLNNENGAKHKFIVNNCMDFEDV